MTTRGLPTSADRSHWAMWDGQWLPLDQVLVSVDDPGLMHGAILVERMRTFGGIPFLQASHEARMSHGARYLGWKLESPLADWITQLLEKNRQWVATQGGDVGVVVLGFPPTSQESNSRSRLLLHLTALPWRDLSRWYQQGLSLWFSDIRATDHGTWPVWLKSRSRLNYYQADRQVHLAGSDGIALLAQADGMVADTSVANLLVCTEQGSWVTPSWDAGVIGITLLWILERSMEMGQRISVEPVSRRTVERARELWLCGTTSGLCHVSTLQGRPCPIPAEDSWMRRFRENWFEWVGTNFVADALGVSADGAIH
jgi:branched-subunit amino acid aminotransferase/4-amino-4-deoxychorismate lyase